jgi:hypothetical protein
MGGWIVAIPLAWSANVEFAAGWPSAGFFPSPLASSSLPYMFFLSVVKKRNGWTCCFEAVLPDRQLIIARGMQAT